MPKKNIIYVIVVFLLISVQCKTQNALPPGYPERGESFDVLPGFVNPPKGYGEVPFYWWQGDTLTHERLLWQLDQLTDKGISSLQINYSHLDRGGLIYGLSRPSNPALFSNAWWDLFKWFSAEAHKRGMTVSLSDYTLGIGQGFSMDEALSQNPSLNGSMLKQYTGIFSGSGNAELPENLLTLTAVKLKPDSSLIVDTRTDLLPEVKNNNLSYNFVDGLWKITGVYSEKLIPSYDPMNPQSGKAYNKYFFEKFEKAVPWKGNNALNFFFSDELNFRVNGNIWNNSFPEEFRKRKGYDILPYLDALFINIGDITPKIRLDYNDVIVSLSEENFFKPVYQWHQDRGMIFGCDHGGRGRDVAEFGDYFRTQRWNQGPGSDQPYLSKDIIKAKVASSIAHLYERPRVWLEGFHSSGWGTSSSDVTEAIFANFVAGYNLLSFHGLYYGTPGGWWEWAPPDNHFRMPYWKQIDPLMDCIQRLSYILSQGYHKCDVAIIYPTEPVVAGMDGERSVSIAFKTGEELYNKGIDFDFIDFESIARAEVVNHELHVSGEEYKILIVPSMKAIRYSSLKKIEQFKKEGGIVVNIGSLPEATEKSGTKDKENSNLIETVFSDDKSFIQCDDIKAISSTISEKYEADFKILSELKERPYVMHRVIGKRDVFALYNFPAGSRCFFREKGQVQLWNPWNGEISSLSGFARKTDDGTEVTLPLSEKEIQIIVFCQEDNETRPLIEKDIIINEITLDNRWEFELKPSLDNKWGDFQLPASNELLGAQVRQMYFKENIEYKGGKLAVDSAWKRVTCAYGAQFLILRALAELPPEEVLLQMNPQKTGDKVTIGSEKYKWDDYAFSWQQGVEGDYGHQGYHGLKGEMYDNFIRLGAFKDVAMSLKRIPEAEGNFYILYTTVIAPSEGSFDLLSGDVKPYLLYVNNSKTNVSDTTLLLRKGVNTLLLVYNRACETYLLVRKHEIPFPEKQPLSMRWYGDGGILPFVCPGKNDAGFFAFTSAPGLSSLSFAAYGKVTAWIDGARANLSSGQKANDGLTSYKITPGVVKKECSQVVLKIEYQPGYYGAAAIPQYINEQCGTGFITTGDWSEIDGLRSYSGGTFYWKTITIEAKDLKNRIEIDLGDLVSSAELFINGKSAGIRLSPPWKFDISRYAVQGENKIEVLIYNTLANNYTSIPTRYRGAIKSGLIGPVKIRLLERNK